MFVFVQQDCAATEELRKDFGPFLDKYSSELSQDLYDGISEGRIRLPYLLVGIYY